MLRINQLAKEIGVSNNAIIEALEKRLGVTGKSHSSNLTAEQITVLRQLLKANKKSDEDSTPLGVHPPKAPVRVVKGSVPSTPSAPVLSQPSPAPPVLVKKIEPAITSPVEPEATVQPEPIQTTTPVNSAPLPALTPSSPRAIPPPAPASSPNETFSKLRVSASPLPAPKTQEPARYIKLPQPSAQKPKPEAGSKQERSKSETGKPLIQRQGQGTPHTHSKKHPKVQRSGMPQQEKTVLRMATNTGKGEVKYETPAPVTPSRRPYIPPSISQLQPEQGFTRIKMADEPVVSTKSQEPAR
ncbi:MAG: translation initiation factor IF-2 N-terminal domain-containing protein, partial [Holophagales bacterium]|nr:translation initiation factor IF-2 N-terminal domain-containing protein [Holophagales bacterium]